MIERRMATYQQVLRGTASFFDVLEFVSREDFRKHAERQALDQYFPGIQGIGFAQAISPDFLASHVDAVRAEGFPSYSVQPSGQRDLYSSSVSLEPFSGRNLRAFGFDMYTEPVRRAAMQRSVDTGEMALTGRVRLVQESGVQEQTGFLIYQAIYAQGRPAVTVEERQAHLRGWVYAPFRPGDLMASLDRGATPILAVRLLDAAPDGTDSLLFADAAERFAHTIGMTPVRVPIEFAGRRWQLEAFPSAGAASVLERRRPWEYLAGGVLISLLLFGVVWSMATTRDRAHALALSMTQALRRANEALDQRVAERTAELVAANERLRALAEAGVVIGGLPDSAARLDHLAEQARRLVDCDCAVLAPGAPGGGAPSLKAARPLTQARRDELVAAA